MSFSVCGCSLIIVSAVVVSLSAFCCAVTAALIESYRVVCSEYAAT